MEPVWVVLAVAVISGPLTALVGLVNKGRKENHEDHAKVMQGLERIEGKIDNHLNWHIENPQEDKQ